MPQGQSTLPNSKRFSAPKTMTNRKMMPTAAMEKLREKMSARL
jgi:hypothetical protein